MIVLFNQKKLCISQVNLLRFDVDAIDSILFHTGHRKVALIRCVCG